MRVRIAVAALAGAILVALIGVAAPSPRRVNIRWAESVALSQRVAAEQSLGVQHPLPEGERTFSYEVPDAGSIPGILAHPLIEDIHRIDRDQRAFSAELPPLRARVRSVYQLAPIHVTSEHWLAIAGVLGVGALVLGWRQIRDTYARAPDRVLIPMIVAAALISRLAIVVAGGQFYWPDEDRYRQSRAMVEELSAGNARAAWDRSVEPAHPLFKVIGMAPAAVEWTYTQDPRIPAAFFALFSVANIWLLAGIARRLGADAFETTLAALLFAASTSFLYFARHLFPYDVATTFGLLALRAGIQPGGSWRSSLACGGWAALAFLAYFGYWTLGAAACIIHVLGDFTRKGFVRRGLLTTAGLATPLLLIGGVATLLGGNIVANTRRFVADVNQGSFAEGWRVPFEYLWHTEHGLFVLWIAAALAGLAAWRRWISVPRVRVGLVGLIFVYATLALFSSGVGSFVVYGRLARQLVPFLCLVTAAVVVRVIAPRRLALAAVSLAVLMQAAFNARQVFEQQFPPEFIVRGERAAGMRGAPRAVPLYTAHLYPPVTLEVPAGMAEAFSARHPLQFKPYQYEGYTPRQREFLRSTDIRMRILVPRTD